MSTYRIYAIICFISGLVLSSSTCYFMGVHNGAKRQKAIDSEQYLQDLTQAIDENEKKVAKIEFDYSEKLNKGLADYEKFKTDIETTTDSQLNEFGSLRAKACNPDLSKTKPGISPGGSNDTSTAARGGQPGEVDFNGVARKIIELGEQLDKQNAKLHVVQDVLSVCLKVQY